MALTTTLTNIKRYRNHEFKITTTNSVKIQILSRYPTTAKNKKTSSATVPFKPNVQDDKRGMNVHVGSKREKMCYASLDLEKKRVYKNVQKYNENRRLDLYL
jgi:hypothetical protein